MKKRRDPDDKKCVICGKIFTVLHPDRWAYKRPKGQFQHIYFCSWKCLRGYEMMGQGEKDMHKVTLEEKKKAVQIALDGGNPLPYLKKIGSRNPSSSWRAIRDAAVRQDPEMETKLPATFRAEEKKPEAVVETAKTIPEQVPVVKVQGPIKVLEDRQGDVSVELVQDQRIRQEYRTEQELKKMAAGPELIDGIEPLQAASLWSRVLEDGTFTKVKGIGMLLRGVNYQILLSAYDWFKLTEEILMAIRQLNADEPGEEEDDEDDEG